MVRHDDKFVQQVSAAIAVSKQRLEQDFRDFSDLENRAPLPAFRRNEI